MNNSDKIILSLCSGTGSWERPYVEAGYDVRSITLPAQDVRYYKPPKRVYGILAAPPCTMFSYARSTAKTPRDFTNAMLIVKSCLKIIEDCITDAYQNGNCDTFKFWALENPARSYLVRFIGKPTLIYQPSEYGDHWTKMTGIWGWFKNPIKKSVVLTVDELRVTKINSSKRLSLLPSALKSQCNTQADLRSITPPGFARAFFEANK